MHSISIQPESKEEFMSKKIYRKSSESGNYAQAPVEKRKLRGTASDRHAEAHNRKQEKRPVPAGVFCLIAAALLVAAAAAWFYHTRQTAAAAVAESAAAAAAAAAHTPTPEPAPTPTPEPTPTPVPEPEAIAADSTAAERIALAQESDLSQYPELQQALADSETAYFLAVSLTTDKTLCYQADSSLYLASAIKAPYSLYVCSQLDAGNIADDEQIQYTEEFHLGGSGIIKNDPVGSWYSVNYLLEQCLLQSDNIAYSLLVNRCGRDSFNEFLYSLGVTTSGMHLYTSIWPAATPREMALVWAAILDYIESDASHASLMKHLLVNSSYSPIRKALNYQRTVASKYGWDAESYVDAGIVYTADGQPDYLLVLLTANGELEDGTALAVTSNIVRQIHEIMTSAA